jgi:6-pyruvoyltetrahydropterin/6-carboxytetrahydropterin synthase
MNTTQTITRKGSFDSAHRVMNERMKCFNLHGHTYLYELVFEFDSMKDIGYAIDFKEIKRVGCQWIDDYLDHGSILNPQDTAIIESCIKINSKLWLMSLNGQDKYCNPSAENISKEIFIAVSFLLNSQTMQLAKVRLYETPNCYTDCFAKSISQSETDCFLSAHRYNLAVYKANKGSVDYDDRNLAVTTTS